MLYLKNDCKEVEMKGKVIEPKKEKEEAEKESSEETEKESSEETEKESFGEEEERQKAGDLLPYIKEVEHGVLDEEGNRIVCESPAIAKILSLLLKKNE